MKVTDEPQAAVKELRQIDFTTTCDEVTLTPLTPDMQQYKDDSSCVVAIDNSKKIKADCFSKNDANNY